MLTDLLADGFVGVVALDGGRLVGVMCGRTTDGVGFVPAHGLAVEPDGADPTAVVVRLFAELAPVLLDDGASRFTIDHVGLDPLGTALSNLGFGRASVFATQVPRPIECLPAGGCSHRFARRPRCDRCAQSDRAHSPLRPADLRPQPTTDPC